MVTYVGFQYRTAGAPLGYFAIIDKPDKVDQFKADTAGQKTIDIYSQSGILTTTCVADSLEGYSETYGTPPVVFKSLPPGAYVNPDAFPQGVAGVHQLYYMGARLHPDPADTPPTTTTDTSLLPVAYGSAPDGTDGGAFTEFKKMPEPENVTPATRRSEAIPNLEMKRWYTLADPYGYGTSLEAFLNYWFDMAGSTAQNVRHLVGATTDPETVFKENYSGVCYVANRDCTIFINECGEALPQKEVVNHEIGHSFDLVPSSGGHIDSDTADGHMHQHDDNGSDSLYCIMSYFDSTGEFCVHCLNHLRNRDDN